MMRKRRSRWKPARLAWVLLLILVPTASGCGRPTATPEPVTVTFAYPESELEYYADAVEAFNAAHAHITVEIVSAGVDDADVFIFSLLDLPELLGQNAFLDLDPFVEQDQALDLSDFYPGSVEVFERDGKLVALPAGLSMQVLFYNQDLFDAYGVPYPSAGWTWNDFLDAARALSDPQADVFGYGILDPYIDPLAFIYQHGGSIVDDVQNPTRMTFDDPRTIEAMEWYAALIHDYEVALPPNQARKVGGSIRTGVYLNQIAMWSDWIDQRGGGTSGDLWPGEWKMRWGMAPLPQDAQAAAPTVVTGYAISAQTDHPQACWQWVSFLSQQTRPPLDMVPARRSLAESDDYARLVGEEVADVVQAAMADAVLFSPSAIEFVDITIYGSAMNAIVEGGVDPEAALIRAQQAAEGAP